MKKTIIDLRNMIKEKLQEKQEYIEDIEKEAEMLEEQPKEEF